jgi:hypothetical protein
LKLAHGAESDIGGAPCPRNKMAKRDEFGASVGIAICFRGSFSWSDIFG